MELYKNNSMGKIPSVIFLAIFLLFVISSFIRLASFDSKHNIHNLDASYHVLLTVKAMDDTPINIHKFLPIVSLGKQVDKEIPWGATVPDDYGNYYYTSFPPLGFLVPYLYFKTTGFEINLKNLMLLNLVIHYLATLILCKLLSVVLRNTNITIGWRSVLLLLAASSYLFSFEALYSHGIIYWHHSLFQVVWLVQLLALIQFAGIARKDLSESRNPVTFFIIIIASLLAPLIEWTGYISNIAVIIYLCWNKYCNKAYIKISHIPLAIGVLCATISAGLIFIIHFLLVLKPQVLFDALLMRFTSRSSLSEVNDWNKLSTMFINGYWESYGLLIVLAIILPVITIFLNFLKKKQIEFLSPNFFGIMFLILFPLFENLLMLNHATFYHFDRLKALIPIIFLITISISIVSGKSRKIMIIFWMIAIVGNLWAFESSKREYDISQQLNGNKRILEKIRETAKPCAIYAINGAVRGWVNLTFEQGVFEGVQNPDHLRAITEKRNACQGVLLFGQDLGNKIYSWDMAIIYNFDKKHTNM